MKKLTPIKNVSILLLITPFLFSCTPEIGSPKWCEMMKKKDKGEWTLNEGKDFLKHCVIEKDEE